MRKKQELAAATMLAAVVLAGCSGPAASAPSSASPSASPGVFSVSGELVLGVTDWRNLDNRRCSGLGGFSDIKSGAQVRVSDAAGKVLALGALRSGTQADRIDGVGIEGGYDSCVFAFTVMGVPDAGPSAVYGVEVSHRGVVNITRDQAGKVALELG